MTDHDLQKMVIACAIQDRVMIGAGLLANMEPENHDTLRQMRNLVVALGENPDYCMLVARARIITIQSCN